MWMAPRVVAERADPRRRADVARPQADAAADDEEGRPGMLPTEDADEPKRVRARPVVERQREVTPTRVGAIHRLRRVHQALGRRKLVDGGKRERSGQHEADEVHLVPLPVHYETSRTSAPGIASINACVATGKTACGVPAAHQTVSKRRNDASTTVRRGRSWPRGGTPPIAKPVASRTSSPRA